MHYHFHPASPTTPATLSDYLTDEIPTSYTVIAALLIDPDVRNQTLARAHSILVDTPVPSVSSATNTAAGTASTSSS
ncbi:hypothetical protein V501_07272 [Pseudogymnoascus sp. VKM F-4519 (FW-2642)]|nr:hypothetical protein V501_07272 [Pseudogymnoascus sp. VKM F-4519 (FW-2642)]